MYYLSELTPAEIYILTKENLTHQEFLKITFIDLLLKQVLKSFDVQRQPYIQHEIRIYKYVGIGQNFHKYESKNHEKVFLSTFEKDNTLELLFRYLVKIGYQKSTSLSRFKNELIKTDVLKKCFSQNIFQWLLNIHSLTEYGKEIKSKIAIEIQNLNAEISSFIKIDNQKAVELIKVIGGNIFLLENIDYEFLDQIDVGLATEMSNKQYSADGSGCSGFNWSYDSFSSDFDSGCSGDSDSSGCSGCGGCGGD